MFAWRNHICQSKQQEDSGTSAHPPNAIVLMLAASAGLVENAAVLLFSIDTRIAAIASTYAVVTMLVGLLAFRERLVRSQVAGIGLVLGLLALLAFNPP